jgi:type II restriction/modification system DNA methylase subunit YeeA
LFIGICAAMTPTQFIRKWSSSTLSERGASQSHFIDLCHLLGEPTPTELDPEGKRYAFEKGARKTGGGDGWADVWKHGCFAWEYKGKHRDLQAAFAQLQRYAIALENPPMLVVSDMETIQIHTNFTNTIENVFELHLQDLENEEKRRTLKLVFTDPEQLKPGVTREKLTEDAAQTFALLAQRLHAREHDPRRVAHFINKLVFCMFAEDINILPPKLLTHLLEKAALRPDRFLGMARSLFAAMRVGGSFGSEFIDWFNGGLFDDEDVLPLNAEDLKVALAASRLDWSAIEPSIFGTLFERGLDPSQRTQLGAHYTDARSIMRIVEPVVIAPLKSKWQAAKSDIAILLEKSRRARNRQTSDRHYKAAKQRYLDFKGELINFRVLDAACGSGNFLYLALLGLKDLELQVMLEGEAELGMQEWFPMIDPQNVLGIEINPYAAELARLTIWIGQIQWMLRHGYQVSSNPVLKSLDQIACRDALLNEDGSESEWPKADCIIGNPPFLGNKKMIAELGETYATNLRNVYKAEVPGGADLVAFWFAKARKQIENHRAERAGLVATNSIRGGDNRKVLDKIAANGRIFEAWSDEPWILDGAAVRVSIVCFSTQSADASLPTCVNGQSVEEIHADLTARTSGGIGVNLTSAKRLTENADVIFMGTTKVGQFDVSGEIAREWLKLPPNPNGRPNSDVVRPWANAKDLTQRSSDRWIIDFGTDLTEDQAALYEAPFEYLLNHVKRERTKNRRGVYARYWWRFGETRPALRSALATLKKSILTPSVAKHRLFVFRHSAILPDHAVFVVTRDDDATFGVLHSRFHELWSLRMGTSLEDRPRYTPSSTFETFPFPTGLTPDIPASRYASDLRGLAIAEAARQLNKLREDWLNPSELIRRMPEVVTGLPDRLVPSSRNAETELRKRTLTEGVPGLVEG